MVATDGDNLFQAPPIRAEGAQKTCAGLGREERKLMPFKALCRLLQQHNFNHSSAEAQQETQMEHQTTNPKASGEIQVPII